MRGRCHKHGSSKRMVWRKIYIAIDEETLEIRAVEVTFSAISDAPILSKLLDQNDPSDSISRVTADGALDTRACHDAIAARWCYSGHIAAQEMQGAENHPVMAQKRVMKHCEHVNVSVGPFAPADAFADGRVSCNRSLPSRSLRDVAGSP